METNDILLRARLLLSVRSGVCIVNPSSTQPIAERDELIMMRPTSIGKNSYRGSPIPVTEVDISELLRCLFHTCSFKRHSYCDA